MKATVFVLCLLSVSSVHAQFLQQFPQQQQPIIVYPQQQQLPQQQPGNNGDHTILQILAMQNMFSTQTAIQQAWSERNDTMLRQVLAQQEGFRNGMVQQTQFEQVWRNQMNERDSLRQQQMMEAIRAGQIQQSRRRGLFGR